MQEFSACLEPRKEREISHPNLKKERGIYTNLVISSIQEGNLKISDISTNTGIKYSTVNSIIASLEKQNRVVPDDPFAKRQFQQFSVIHAARRSEPIYFRNHHMRLDQQDIYRLLGMGSLPSSFSTTKGRIIIRD